MNSEEIFEKVKEIIVEQLGTPEASITMESSFLDDLGADSLDIKIPDEDAEKVSTIGDVVEYIKAHVG